MAIQITKVAGEVLNVWQMVTNLGPPQEAYTSFTIINPTNMQQASSGFSSPVSMPAGGEHEFSNSMTIPIAFAGIFDVYVDVWNVETQAIVTSGLLPGELEVVAPPVTYYTLTMSISGQGSTVPGPGSYSYPAGDWAWLSATPASGWAFSHFLVNGFSSHYENPYPLYMDSDKTVIALFYEEAPPTETVAQQLASCWPYISGGGTRADNLMIYAYRNGVYLTYSTQTVPPIDEIGAFIPGDVVGFYLMQQCTLNYQGRTWVLTPYYNPTFPDWITAITW